MALNTFPTFSVVVPCYNVEHVIDKCIESLLNQDYPKEKFTIIVVDDKSTDNTLKIIKKYEENDGIKIIKHFKNRGLSVARNSGIKASNSQIIGFLDSDIVVTSDWIKVMVDELSKNEVIACMGDTKLPEEYNEDKIDKFLYHSKRGARKTELNQPVEIPGFIMGNSAVERNALENVGYFDENFYVWGGEDTDLAIRLWQKHPNGLRFVREAIGSHYHQKTMEQILENIYKYGRTNYLILLKKYPQLEKRLAGDWVNSFKGKIVFSPIINSIIKLVYFVMPTPYLVRYFIAYSLMKGARNPKEGMSELRKK